MYGGDYGNHQLEVLTPFPLITNLPGAKKISHGEIPWQSTWFSLDLIDLSRPFLHTFIVSTFCFDLRIVKETRGRRNICPRLKDL